MGDSEGSTGSFRQVEDWLRSLGLICYAQSFYDNGYENLDICRQIEEQDLDVIGIKNVKDRSDIIAGVCRLRQKPIYFELESEEESSTEKIRRKFDPFLLITRVKAELENSNVQLTEPPYFYPDGSLGSLDSLAETISYALETFSEDVLSALNQLRSRQLPASVYNDVHEMMDLQRQQEVKKNVKEKLVGPPKPKRVSIEEPKAYLNVETPFRRTTSLSKNDQRITKSTTNLADIEFGDDKPLTLVGAKKSKKLNPVVKSYSTRDKSKTWLSFSTRKRSTTAENKSTITKESFVAKDLTLKQDELIDLMTQVKHGQISQDKVIAKAELNYRLSVHGDHGRPKKIEKHQLTKKERKKLEKEEKKKKKWERGKSTGQSFFYSTEINDNEATMCGTSGLLSETGQVDDVISLGNSSGSDVSRSSPDLRSFGEGKTKTALHNGSVLNTSNDSVHSSTGCHDGQLDTPNVKDTRATNKLNNVKLGTKTAMMPPPVPVRSDHGEDMNLNNQKLFNGKKPLKSVLSAPLSEKPIGAELGTSDLTSSKSQEFATERSNTSKVDTSGKSGMVLALGDLEEIKQRSLERKQRTTSFPKEQDGIDKEILKSVAPKNAPIPPKRADRTTAVKAVPAIIPLLPAPVANEGKTEPQTKQIDQLPTGSTVETVEEQKPAPPPRRIEKDIEKKPIIPPRKRRSDMNEPDVDKAVDNCLNEEKSVASSSIPYVNKPVAKPKPQLPPRSGRGTRPDSGDYAKEIKSASTKKELLKRDSNQSAPDFNEPSNIVDEKPKYSARFKPLSLWQLIEMKCLLEHVDLSKYPYSDQNGCWNVPYLLTKRYSDELYQPLPQVVQAMDEVRMELIKCNGRVAKRANVEDVMRNTKCDPVTTSVEGWLISRGLPMFINNFNDCGLLSLEQLKSLTKTDVLLTGVYDIRHVDQLLICCQELFL